MTIAGVILAGGRNSRMGGIDKSFLVVDDQTIIERTVKLLKGFFDELVIVTNSPERYDFPGVKMVSDLIKEAGPLGGIHAGLSAVAGEAAFVFACDMPALSAEVIARQLSKFKKEKPDCLIAKHGEWLEPLHSIYRKELVPIIERTIKDGKYSVRDFIGRCQKTSYFDLSTKQQKSLRNLNAPEDMQNE